MWERRCTRPTIHSHQHWGDNYNSLVPWKCCSMSLWSLKNKEVLGNIRKRIWHREYHCYTALAHDVYAVWIWCSALVPIHSKFRKSAKIKGKGDNNPKLVGKLMRRLRRCVAVDSDCNGKDNLGNFVQCLTLEKKQGTSRGQVQHKEEMVASHSWTVTLCCRLLWMPKVVHWFKRDSKHNGGK